MKRQLLALTVAALGITSASAAIIGMEDNSTEWWSAFSQASSLTGNGTIHFDFVNYTDGATNWNNWLLVIDNNGLSPIDEGYSSENELVVLRADNYGWGTLYANATLSCNYNWDTFIADMNGANVSLDVVRKGSVLTTKANITTTAGTSYLYTVVIPGVQDETIGAFLTVEKGHLDLISQTVTVDTDPEPETPIDGELVGNVDNSSPWWTVWSKATSLTGNGYIHYQFENYSSMLEMWHNWALVVTNSGLSPLDQGYAGDQELIVLRADNYGWGTLYESCVLNNNYDWTTIKTDLNGATVDLKLERDGQQLAMTALTTTTEGKEYTYTAKIDGVTAQMIGTFLTVESGHLVIKNVEVVQGTTSISTISADAVAIYYDMRGVQVNPGTATPGLYIVKQGNTISKRMVK